MYVDKFSCPSPRVVGITDIWSQCEARQFLLGLGFVQSYRLWTVGESGVPFSKSGKCGEKAFFAKVLESLGISRLSSLDNHQKGDWGKKKPVRPSDGGENTKCFDWCHLLHVAGFTILQIVHVPVKKFHLSLVWGKWSLRLLFFGWNGILN